MKVLLAFSCIIILFFSCSKNVENKDDEKIYIVSKDSWNNENRIDSTYFKIIKSNSEIIYQYEYPVNDSVLSYYLNVEKTIENNKTLRIYNEECLLVDTLSFTFNKKRIKIHKYLYDVKGTEDDMTDYYFNEELGIVFAKDLSWDMKFYYNPKDLKPLHDSILKNEEKFKSSFKFIRETIIKN